MYDKTIGSTVALQMLYPQRVTLVFLTQFVFTLSFVIYCLLIVINFAEMFHFNLTRIHHKRQTDAWLQARCKEQEFVHHIRHHIDLCETVEREALTNAYLVAIQLALDGLHLCGSYSCEKILVAVTESLRLSIYTWLACSTLVIIMIPTCFLPLYRRWQRNLLLHENHLAENALVPSIYIQDSLSNIQKSQFRAHPFPISSGNFITEPRQRRLMPNSTDTYNECEAHFGSTPQVYPYHDHNN
jgi:hypothetical protein